MPQPDDELKRFLQAYPDTSHVDVLFIDLCGNAIGKRLPGSALSALFATGTPVCAAMQLGEAMGNTADPMGYGFSDGDPDAYAIPLPGTLRPVPWLSGNKSQVLCQYVAAGDGKPLWFEPGQVLKRVLERFTELDASLPLTIWRALDCIQQAAILPEYFGADYLQIYHQIKQAEFDAFMEAIHARDYAWYL